MSRRILFTVDPEIPVPPPLYGGIERIVDGLVREFRGRGYQVGLLAHADSTCEADARFAWPAGTYSKLSQFLRLPVVLRRAASAFQPSVLHSFSRLHFLFAARTLGCRAVMSYQRHTGGRKLATMARLWGRRLRYTGCSEFISNMGRRGGGTWTTVPNFVDTRFYRAALEVPADAPLVFLSRLEAIKGVHRAIAIAKKAQRRLVIAGNQVSSTEGKEYWEKEIAPHLGLPGIEYVGAVNDDQKRDLLRLAAAMIVPIEWDEPFGIVFAESLACGTPVISCPRGALPEIIRHGQHGFLINSDEEGVEAVGKLPSISRAACRARAEENYSLQRVADQYAAIYEELTCPML